MRGREVVERQQRVPILAQAVGRLLVFGRVALDEGVERPLGGGLGFGHPDLLQCAWLSAWGSVVTWPPSSAARAFSARPRRRPAPLQIKQQIAPRQLVVRQERDSAVTSVLSHR